MAKISELSDGGSLQSTDFLIAVRSGGNVKVQADGNLSLGTVTADGLTVDGVTDLNIGTANIGIDMTSTDEGSYIQVNDNNATGFYFGARAGSFDLYDTDNNAILKANSNGDISFYEDTGTTAKFFWDASAESLGIGTSPASELHVKGSTPDLRVENTTASETVSLSLIKTGTKGFSINNKEISGTNYLTFNLDTAGAGTDAMVIHPTSGNVGIGNSSPEAKLSMLGGSLPTGNSGGSLSLSSALSATRLTTDASSNTSFIGSYYDDTCLEISQGSTAGYTSGIVLGARSATNATVSDAIAFYTRSDEAMRISSGNLLVGTTTVNGTGITLGAGNYGYFSRSGDAALFVNRSTSDGSLIELRKADVAVGSIGTRASLLKIGTGDVGLLFNSSSDAILPENIDGGAGRDGAIDLGVAGARFKDLYLSGGVVFGDAGGSGTATSNSLDSYEEGTFTPQFADAASGGNTASVTTLRGRYTKIGDVVYIAIVANGINTTGMTGVNDLVIRNLPFTNKNDIDYPQFNAKTENVAFDASANLSGQLWTGSTYIKISESFSATNEDFITVNQVTSTSGIISITGFYFAA